MKKLIFTIILVNLSSTLFAQYSLYNSRTLYDAFENPAQKAFYADSSRKYAFNFFIPTASASSAFIGPGQHAFKSLAFRGGFDGSQLSLGNNEVNTLAASSNTYLLMFRIFRAVRYNREAGFAWQIRSDGRIRVTNETLAIFDSYRLFGSNQYDNIFNNNGINQSYHQFSFSYREDFSKRLGLGVKLSLLSGITYNKLDMDQSGLVIDRDTDSFMFYMKGRFRSNYKVDKFDKTAIIPTFKSPGFAVTASANYKLRDGWYILGNLKDIGLIKWNKDSYNYEFETGFTLLNASGANDSKRLGDQISGTINRAEERRAFTTPINGKAEILINKDLNNYQPNLILSKNLFYTGADIALINNYKVKNYVFTVSTAYNTNKYFQAGGQLMIKSPNTEFFIGSDQLIKTYNSARSLFNKSADFGNGYSGASAYLGFALKFGRDMEHQANANTIPGFSRFDRDEDGGFLKRLFTKKPKRTRDRDDDTKPDF